MLLLAKMPRNGSIVSTATSGELIRNVFMHAVANVVLMIAAMTPVKEPQPASRRMEAVTLSDTTFLMPVPVWGETAPTRSRSLAHLALVGMRAHECLNRTRRVLALSASRTAVCATTAAAIGGLSADLVAATLR